MPQEIHGSPLDIMKAISMFDIDTDFDDIKRREKLGMLFHTLVMSNDPKSKEFIARFLKQVSNVIADMGVIEKPKDEPEDEVELPTDDEIDVGDEAPEEDIPVEEPNTEEEPVDDTEDEEPIDDEVPDELLGAGFNPLISRANSFLNY